MQVGFAFSGGRESWSQDDDAQLELLQAELGPAWSVDRRNGGRRKSVCLSAREDALHLIERAQGDRLALLRVRDEFFRIRWADVADAPARSYDWLKRRI
jgi:hypothetical protein